MRKGDIIVVLAVVINVTAVFGNEWTSPDGVIVVTAPDPDHFQLVEEPPAPFIVLWFSQDVTATFGVVKVPIPPNIRLVQSSVEQGFAKELGGTITASSSIVKNGHEVWTMTAEAASQGVKTQATQAVAQYDGVLYKGIAAVMGNDPANDKTAKEFVGSFRIVPANLDRRSNPFARFKQINQADLSQIIGGAGLMLLIVAAIVLVARRGKMK